MLRGIGAEAVAAGETFRFGRGREGDLDLLERLGFDVRRVPLVENVSSSRIRELLARRRAGARRERCSAGRPRSRGSSSAATDAAASSASRPRTSTFPTDLLVPPDGVYAGAARDRRAAVSIGTNPHFDGVERRVEAHLLDFDGDLYGERLVVEIWSPIREQRRFDSLEELVAAIGDDVEQTRAAVRPGLRRPSRVRSATRGSATQPMRATPGRGKSTGGPSGALRRSRRRRRRAGRPRTRDARS